MRENKGGDGTQGGGQGRYLQKSGVQMRSIGWETLNMSESGKSFLNAKSLKSRKHVVSRTGNMQLNNGHILWDWYLPCSYDWKCQPK